MYNDLKLLVLFTSYTTPLIISVQIKWFQDYQCQSSFLVVHNDTLYKCYLLNEIEHKITATVLVYFDTEKAFFFC